MTSSLSLDCIVIILDPHQENVAKGMNFYQETYQTNTEKYYWILLLKRD